MLGNIGFEAVQESLSKTDHKRGQQKKFTDEDHFETGNYAAIHGPSFTVKKFKNSLPNLTKSTVRIFRDKHRKNLKQKTIDLSTAKKNSALKYGRPLMLNYLDEKIKTFVLALHKKEGVVNTVVAIATAKALIEQSEDEVDRP